MVHRNRGRDRASVIMGTPGPVPFSVMFIFPSLFTAERLREAARKYRMYANSGMEPLIRRVVWPFAFYDVDNPAAMLAAVDRARTGSAW